MVWRRRSKYAERRRKNKKKREDLQLESFRSNPSKSIKKISTFQPSKSQRNPQSPIVEIPVRDRSPSPFPSFLLLLSFPSSFFFILFYFIFSSFTFIWPFLKVEGPPVCTRSVADWAPKVHIKIWPRPYKANWEREKRKKKRFHPTWNGVYHRYRPV